MTEHDFKKYPELTNAQLDDFYWSSPHKQIFENFHAKVVKVHDADTINVLWNERSFDFPIRISNLSARELKETKTRDTSMQLTADGRTAQKWLENMLLGQDVEVKINAENRVDKFGRLLGTIEFKGVDIAQEGITSGMVTAWERKNDGMVADNIKDNIRVDF